MKWMQNKEDDKTRNRPFDSWIIMSIYWKDISESYGNESIDINEEILPNFKRNLQKWPYGIYSLINFFHIYVDNLISIISLITHSRAYYICMH